MPKIVILGSCRFEPYEVLAVPNKVPNAWNTEEGYKIAAQKFYPAIEKADLIICFAPDGVGEHTKRDVEYAESLGKKVHMITEFSNGSGSEGGSATVVTDKGSRTVSVRHAKSGESDSRVAVGMSSGKPAPQPKTQDKRTDEQKIKDKIMLLYLMKDSEPLTKSKLHTLVFLCQACGVPFSYDDWVWNDDEEIDKESKGETKP